MALIHHTNNGIYAGVSKQAIDLRTENHCEEMINCYPSVTYGVRRRNPTQLISNSIMVSDSQFMHTYDRGLAGESEEQYLITIDRTNGLRVFDVNASAYRTVSYSGSALKYLESSNPEIGFSAITVKDTTFIANKDIIPLRVGEVSTSGGTITKYNKTINIDTAGYSSLFSTLESNVHPILTSLKTTLAPCTIKTFKGTYTIEEYVNLVTTTKTLTTYSEVAVGAMVSIVIDGTTYKYQVAVKNGIYNTYPETIYEMRSNIYSMLSSQLPSTLYTVELTTSNAIVIYRLDGVNPTVTSSISFAGSVDINPPALQSASTIQYTLLKPTYKGGITTKVIKYSTVSWIYQTTYNIGSGAITSITSSSGTVNVTSTSDYDKLAFVWIKQVSVDTAFPYTFYLTLKETSGATIATTSSAATTTTGVASALATWADGVAGFTAVVSGSVIKITRDNGTAFEVLISDTFGDQASSAWKGSINQIEDLPKSFPFKDVIVKIDGIQTSDDVAYWVKYDGNKWVEHRDPTVLSKIDATTMPHKLVRNADYTFTLSSIAWNDMLVGDADTQAIPEFIGNGIKDLFFVNGRLGILTKNGISLSQQGQFYNFFRTTVLTLLDDSAITTYIDSSKSVGLEYAVELQGNVILFGDKLQFALDTSKPISPKSISIQPISGFEINKNVKPISSGDSIFFLVANGGYTSLMEMNKSTLSMNIRANDVSAHVPNYIDSDIMQMSISARDNCVFLRSRSVKNTIYVYKWFGTETEKSQMSWSKWKFDMNINSIFSFDKELYIFGSRYNTTVPLDEYSLVSIWDDYKYWIDETYWTDGTISSSPSFEKIIIEPLGNSTMHKDITTVRYDSEIELSEWNLSASNKKEMIGNLLMKTVDISSEEGSNFSLVVEDKERGTSRSIPAVYTVDRKPFISGNAKNMKIKILSSNGDGFQINSISLEGQYNVRSKRV